MAGLKQILVEENNDPASNKKFIVQAVARSGEKLELVDFNTQSDAIFVEKEINEFLRVRD